MQVRRVYKPLDLRKKLGKNERGLRKFTQISTGTMNYIGLDNSPHADGAEGFVEICSEQSSEDHAVHGWRAVCGMIHAHSLLQCKRAAHGKRCGNEICEEV